jgi:putative SOS response-associated peptidase YedK
MCGRYTLVKTHEVAERFQVEQTSLDLAPRYNVAPGQELPVVTKHGPNQLEIMRWGLVPSWAKDTKVGYSMINARAEGIQDKPAFRRPLRYHRCIVPASGFYEWQKVNTKTKIPYYFHRKDDKLFDFAGLYDIHTDENGNKLLTYTIITTNANEVVEPVHDRMPVMLLPEDEASWLDPVLPDPEPLLALLKPYPTELMEAYTVSSQVNKPQNDSPALLEPPVA